MSSLYERAAIIPGRSCTRSKSPDRLMKHWAQQRAGAYVMTEDGDELLDMLCGLGANSLGEGSGVCSLPYGVEVDAAETVLQSVAPWASSVRFFKTGSEATHAAYRIAKAATGRSTVLMGDWAFHGWHEWTAQAPTFSHGSLDFPEDVAAIFLEPHRWAPVNLEWLKSVRAFCNRTGALLVFDSMIYGGRWALGGASEYFDVRPDLECFGKALSDGEAAAFLVGREALAEHGEIASGTYSGDWRGLASIVSTVHRYVTEPVIETLWARGRQLQAGLHAAISGAEGVRREGEPVHQRLVFTNLDDQVTFTAGMHARGILWHPACCNVGYFHTEAHIQRVVDAAHASMNEVRRCRRTA